MNDIILGAKHIMDPNGFDHMLFLVALAAAFDLSKSWRMISVRQWSRKGERPFGCVDNVRNTSMMQ